MQELEHPLSRIHPATLSGALIFAGGLVLLGIIGGYLVVTVMASATATAATQPIKWPSRCFAPWFRWCCGCPSGSSMPI